MPNLEKQYIKALEEALHGQVIDTESGFQQMLGTHNVFRAVMPRGVTDNFSLVIEPQGPGFPLESLGRGAGMDARTAVVALNLTVYYEHSDQEEMISTLLDVAWWLNEFMVANQKLGGATRTTVLRGDYDWAELTKDSENDDIVDSTNMGVYMLPIVVEYRRN